MYDVIIIGSGPAGISASLYTQRANLKTLIISKSVGVLEKVKQIENYYGFENPISGKELAENGINQAKRLGVEFIKDEVVKIEKETNFIVETINRKYEAKAIVMATGSSRKNPNIKGIKEFEGRGVSYCATCDAFFYRQKNVAVLGSGQYALHEARELLQVANSVTIFTNGEELIENRDLDLDVEIEFKKVKEVIGNTKVDEIQFEDDSKKPIDGVFIALGVASSSDLARKIGARIDNKNNIIVNQNMQTSIPMLYACGDCTGGTLQIAKAVYEGMVAGLNIIKELRK